MIEITPQEQAEFDHQGDIADELLCSVLDDIPEDVDFVGVLFSLWVQITHMLAEAGFTGEQLAGDAHHHAALATTEGRVQ
jgi:hypothetical protein